VTGRQQLAVGLLVLGVASAIAFGATRYLRKELFPVAVGSVAPDFTAVTLDSIPLEKRAAEYRGQDACCDGAVEPRLWPEARGSTEGEAERKRHDAG